MRKCDYQEEQLNFIQINCLFPSGGRIRLAIFYNLAIVNNSPSKKLCGEGN